MLVSLILCMFEISMIWFKKGEPLAFPVSGDLTSTYFSSLILFRSLNDQN